MNDENEVMDEKQDSHDTQSEKHADAADQAYAETNNDQLFSDDCQSGDGEQPFSRDEEIERLRESADSAEKRVLQAQADAENFRKRMRRDVEDQLKYAAMPLVTDLLQVRDNLHRAIEAAKTSSEASGLRDGVEMVAKQLDDTLAKHQINEIPSEGEVFDPNVHEAISQIPSDEVEEGKVAHVAVVGYKMHDRVIRPSQVIVSTGAAS